VNSSPACIRDIYREQDFALSVEVFPPKTSTGDDVLFRTLARLAAYQPAFVSCAYEANGSTRTRTIDLCVEVQKRYKLTATAHLTCVVSTCDDIIDWLSLAKHSGLRNIMALRGDPPDGQETFRPVPRGLRFANELVGLIREHHPDLGIGVAGYPEMHQEASEPQTDLDNLKRKVDAGADAVFTQLFYVNANFFNFRERCERAGICVPLIPGIMPMTQFAMIRRITSMCGVTFPDQLASKLEAVQDDKRTQFEIGVDHAVRQCRGLIDQGVPGIHFYVLNRFQACEKILNALDTRPSHIDCV